jgi:biotin carboxyl carrier protein
VKSPDSTVESALAELTRLRQFTGPPAEFWPAFLAATSQLAGAVRGVLILRDTGQPPRLRKLGDWSSNGHADRSVLLFTNQLVELAEEAFKTGLVRRVLETGPIGQSHAVAVRLGLPGGQQGCVAAFLVCGVSAETLDEVVVRLQLAADLPLAYHASQAALLARGDVEKFASVLDVLVLVNAETRFLAATLAFCNGLAGRFQCERVSLGWLQQGYVRLKSISRTERFDKHMAAVKAIEVVMEECLDQNTEIVWPAPEGVSLVTRDHAAFCQAEKSGYVVSVPLRVEEKPVAVLTCERAGRAFTQIEIEQLRLGCDQVIRRLADLQRTDRWFGARWAHAARERLAKLVGPEHTWGKVLAVLGAAALVALFLPLFPYRVEGNFILRSDEVSFLTAPFDGYIKSVEVRPGDTVAAGGLLMRLNTDDLALEESMAIADQNRYLREAEKARAAKSLAEMRVFQAQADQAKARLELVRYRLEQAALKAPFAGVIVEGDLRQRIGAPAKQGDALFKVARIDTLYVEAEINERDVHEILTRTAGEIAFVSQPKLKFPIRVVRLEPAAVPKEKQNTFLVRCAFGSPVQPWWRPGMSGVCKIAVERRTLFWVLSHRTVDFVRLLLWW